MRQRRLVSALAVPLVFAFVAASCGSDDSSSDETTAQSGTDATSDDTGGDAGDEGGTADTTPTEAEGDVDTTVVADTEAAVYGGAITMGLEAEANGFRPWEDGCAEPCANIARTFFDPLVDQNVDGEYEGLLAESIRPNDDFTVWTVTLRPDVTFHNGVELTAQTIVDMFAVQQTGSISSGLIATNGITGVEAVDDLAVAYTLAAPNSAFPAALSGVSLGYVFEPAAALADGADFSSEPVGTGPFVIESRD